MKRKFVRAMALSGACAVISLAATTSALASGPDPLLDLLKAKGLISAADMASLQSVPPDAQRDRLIELLRAKGVISASDAARVAGRVAAAPEPVLPSTDVAPRIDRFASAAPPPAAIPVRHSAPQRAPRVLEVKDDGSDMGLIYATDHVNDQSPLSFKIGGVSFYPGGEIRATTVLRSTNVSGANTGNVLGTNFGAIPFHNTIAGNRSDLKITGQGTTLDLAAITDIGPVHVAGYIEFDFNGTTASNVFVHSNSYTLRSRLAYMDATWGNWELAAGQMYSWLTPNRVGLGPNPGSVFLTNNIDDNFNVGLTWTRAAQVRVAYHPNDHWALGIGIENPDQYVGVGEVVFPFAFNAQLGGQFDAGNNSSAPAAYPDVTGKIAYDDNWNGHAVHAEVTGLLTVESEAILPVGGFNFHHQHAVGGGVGFGLNLELFSGFHAIANGFYSEGGGRYVGGLGPNVVVRPIDLGGGAFTAEPSMVRSYSGLAGFEYLVCPDTILSAYYGGAYYERNFFLDPTNPVPGRFAGFGSPNSPNAANRYVWEATFDAVHTIWDNPSYGSVQIAGQLSYMERHPWFVALGAPGYAHQLVGYGDLRFVFP